jgi:hypothetical protein
MGDTNLKRLTTTDGDMTLDIRGTAHVTEIRVRAGTLSLFADGSILDARDADTGGSDATSEIDAKSAVLMALNGIGTAANWLETRLEQLEAQSFVDMWIKNFGDMVVGNVSPAFAGVLTKGTLHLELASTLTVSEAIDSQGHAIRLQASEGIAINAPVSSGGAAVEVLAGTDITFGVAGSIAAQSGAPSVRLIADHDGDRTGRITMADGSSVDAAGGSIEARAYGDITISLLRTTGAVLVVSTAGAILDADTTGADDIVAGSVDLRADRGVGTATNDLEVRQTGSLPRLDVSASGNIYVTAPGALRLGTIVSSTGDVRLTVPDTAAAGENIVGDKGASVRAPSGSVRLLAGDDVRLAAGSAVEAAQQLIVRGDAGSADAAGTTILLEGALAAQLVSVFGGADADSVTLSPESLAGYTRVRTGGGADRIVLDGLPTVDAAHKLTAGSGPATLVNGHHTTARTVLGEALPLRDLIDLDGEGGADVYDIRIEGSTDYLATVHDSGAAGDGADRLSVTGAAGADAFLIRRNFVTRLRPVGPGENDFAPAYERINYDASIEALEIDGGSGDDRFYVDDNAAATTLTGGRGEDLFQFGQVFGAARTSTLPATVAPGDEIATVETTRGHLSRGISFATSAYGGDDGDRFAVYSNQAALRLFGEDGNDEFVVRAFLLVGSGGGTATTSTEVSAGSGDDRVEYSVNAPVTIDGGAGFDTFVAIGTEAADRFVITAAGVFGAGLNVGYAGVERVEVDGAEGDDWFFVLGLRRARSPTSSGAWAATASTSAATSSGRSSARAPRRARSPTPSRWSAARWSSTAVVVRDRTLRAGLRLPTETDGPLPVVVVPTDETQQTDTLNVFDDGRAAATSGAHGTIAGAHAAAIAALYDVEDPTALPPRPTATSPGWG